MKRKTKSTSEPSTRQKLSASFLAALESDFQENSVSVIKHLREQDLGRYAELVAKMIATTEPPPPNDLSNAKSMADIGRALLEGVGVLDPTARQIELACEANATLMDTLESIAAGQSDASLEALEERELRQ